MHHGEGASETIAKAKCEHSSLTSMPWKAHSAFEVQPRSNVPGRTHPKLLREGGTGLVRCWCVLLIPALRRQKMVDLVSSRPAPNVSTS